MSGHNDRNSELWSSVGRLPSSWHCLPRKLETSLRFICFFFSVCYVHNYNTKNIIRNGVCYYHEKIVCNLFGRGHPVGRRVVFECFQEKKKRFQRIILIWDSSQVHDELSNSMRDLLNDIPKSPMTPFWKLFLIVDLIQGDFHIPRTLRSRNVANC